MKCKDIELLVIGSSGEKLDREKTSEIEWHTEHCTKCARLKEEMDNIRSALPRLEKPILPEDLDRRTYQMCKDEMALFPVREDIVGDKTWLKSIPAFMKIAFFCLIVLTVVWAIALIMEFRLEESLSVPTIIFLSLVFQNAVMLIFAPLLLRRFRSKKTRFEIFSVGG